MSLVEFLQLILACWGVMFVVSHSEIFSMLGIRQQIEKIEFFKKLIHCSFCIGTWIGASYGIGCYLLLYWDFKLYFNIATIPLAIATTTYAIERIVFAFDEYINITTKEVDNVIETRYGGHMSNFNFIHIDGEDLKSLPVPSEEREAMNPMLFQTKTTFGDIYPLTWKTFKIENRQLFLVDNEKLEWGVYGDGNAYNLKPTELIPVPFTGRFVFIYYQFTNTSLELIDREFIADCVDGKITQIVEMRSGDVQRFETCNLSHEPYEK